MLQVTIPVYFEPQMVICVNHLMCQCILQVPLISHLIGANLNSKLGIEAASLPVSTPSAEDIMIGNIPIQLSDVVLEKSY